MTGATVHEPTNPNLETTLAVDLGGTHIRVAAVTADGEVLDRHRQETPTDQPVPTIIPELLAAALDRLGSSAPRPTRAVVGVPGIVDHGDEALADPGGGGERGAAAAPQLGRLVHAPNLPSSWTPYLAERWLETETGLDILLANDADLAAVGESSFGAGESFRDVVYVTISTGVGAGVVVGDRLVRGRLSGGELGHTVIDRRALSSEHPASVEDLGSGTALARAAAEAGLRAEGAELAGLVRSGDPLAEKIWNDGIAAVGLGIANLAWIVAPGVVVIGGGVGMNGDLVLPTVEEMVALHGPKTPEPIQVVNAALGDDAALLGAARWWKAVGRDQ